VDARDKPGHDELPAQYRITLRDYADAHQLEQTEPCLKRRQFDQDNELHR
jgi:hypothetical protein